MTLDNSRPMAPATRPAGEVIGVGKYELHERKGTDMAKIVAKVILEIMDMEPPHNFDGQWLGTVVGADAYRLREGDNSPESLRKALVDAGFVQVPHGETD